MKVLLANPINVMPPDPALFGLSQPIHLMYIASYLESKGHDVKIFDTVIDKSVKRFVDSIKKFNPDLVGIGAISPTIYSAWDTAELVKKHTDAKIVMGGDHVTFLPGETLQCCPYVDFVARGEGEITTVELLRYLNGKKKLKEIKGISYKNNNKIIHNPPRPWIKNLDELPYPAWHLVDMYKYIQIVGRAALLVSSRGCSRGCSFCISSRKLGLAWRSRSAESVVNEMIELAGRYPKLDTIVSIDDNFMWDTKRVQEICDLLIKKKFDMPWICQGRSDTIVEGGKNLVDKMAKAGCMAIQIGVESPFKDRLEAVNKGVEKNQSVQAVNLVKNAGIAVRATFLFGFEGETPQKMYQTYEFAKNVINSQAVQFTILTAFPGSPYFEEVKHKLITHDWRRFTVSHQFLNYDFDVEKEMSKLYIKYHLRPRLLKEAREMNINQFTTMTSLITPMIKSILGIKGNYLYDFTPTKWLKPDEEYWQKYILKTNLIFEETWEHESPKIEKIIVHFKPSDEIHFIKKEEKTLEPIIKNQWIRIR
jgi:radical SAM superfamily enzyme YgiQ (UPF0313 family)